MSGPEVPDGTAGAGVFVVLSSYNGGKYIAQQLESIRAQTFADWTLLVRDDGSSDDTVRVVEACAAEDPRVTLLRDGRGNLGAAASFGVLLGHALDAGAGYVALADQDDVWYPHKLAGGLGLLWSREAEVGAGVPLLAHSDVAVAREDLRVIHPSLMAYQGLGAVTGAPLRRLLLQNFVTGCTVILNRPLLRVALPVPERAVMHDWWLALCAAAFGELLYLSEPTLLYRQHGANAVGSRGVRALVIDSLGRPLRWWRRSGALFAAAFAQACELARRVDAPILPPSAAAAAMVREYCGAFLGRGGVLRRFRTVRRHRIAPRSAVAFPLSYYTRVLLWSGRPGDEPSADSTRAVERALIHRHPEEEHGHRA